MSLYLIIAGIVAATMGSLFFSTLTYSLRDFSRSRLGEELEKRGLQKWLEPTLENASDLIVVTAVMRLVANILVLVGTMRLFYATHWSINFQYLLAIVVT